MGDLRINGDRGGVVVMKVCNDKIYGNYKIYSPEGELMFRCNQKKYNWYQSRLLLTPFKDGHKLTFTPNGPGALSEYVLSHKENRCVVCGSMERLSKHHVVPYQYRRHLPIKHKANNSYDVLVLCYKCHSSYEIAAYNFKLAIAEKLDIPWNTQSYTMRRARESAKTLIKHWSILPKVAKEKLHNRVRVVLGDSYTQEDLVNLQNYQEINKHGQLVVEQYQGRIQEFIELWRQHFIQTTNPRFLSDNWTTDYHHTLR